MRDAGRPAIISSKYRKKFLIGNTCECTLEVGSGGPRNRAWRKPRLNYVDLIAIARQHNGIATRPKRDAAMSLQNRLVILVVANIWGLLCVFAAQSKDFTYNELARERCSLITRTYGSRISNTLFDPLVKYVQKMDNKNELGSYINILSYISTICRLNQKIAIEKAVEKLFLLKSAGHLPPIPIGGATADPKVASDWQKFDKWIRHAGPRPNLN